MGQIIQEVLPLQEEFWAIREACSCSWRLPTERVEVGDVFRKGLEESGDDSEVLDMLACIVGKMGAPERKVEVGVGGMLKLVAGG